LRAASPPGAVSSAGSTEPASLPDDLTPREADVLREIAAGRSKAEIAGVLFISEVTVKTSAVAPRPSGTPTTMILPRRQRK
jgi:DNA-binding NarL/FixJ family response regulator